MFSMYFAVDGMSLGELMWRKREVPNIDKPTDSPLECAIKKIIKKMIKLHPADRISITEVVNELSALREATPQFALIAVNNSQLWVQTSSTWERQSAIPIKEAIDHICFCSVPGAIISLGGRDYTQAMSHCYHFSQSTCQWKSLPDMPTARYGVSAIVLSDILFVFGGRYDVDNECNVCEKFHMRDDVWSPAASMMEEMFEPLVATALGKVFIMPRGSGISPDSKIQQYDPTADSFSWAAQIPEYVQDTQETCLVAAGDKLYLFGGEDNLAVQYSPAVEQWVRLQSQPPNMYGFGCCAVVHGGKILLCGGSTDDFHYNMVEEYDVQTQQWKVADFKLPIDFSWDSAHVLNIRL